MDDTTRFLFLDDDRRRQDVFLERHPGAIIVDNATDCIELLKSYPTWYEVHLDHDLEGTYQDSEEQNCGMEVVRWILLNLPDVRTFVIHSHNELAVPVMVKALESVGYWVVRAPFSLRA